MEQQSIEHAESSSVFQWLVLALGYNYIYLSSIYWLDLYICLSTPLNSDRDSNSNNFNSHSWLLEIIHHPSQIWIHYDPIRNAMNALLVIRTVQINVMMIWSRLWSSYLYLYIVYMQLETYRLCKEMRERSLFLDCRYMVYRGSIAVDLNGLEPTSMKPDGICANMTTRWGSKYTYWYSVFLLTLFIIFGFFCGVSQFEIPLSIEYKQVIQGIPRRLVPRVSTFHRASSKEELNWLHSSQESHNDR